MLTPVQAQEVYLKARSALEKIARSRKSNRDQKAAARHARRKLDNDFIESQIAAYEELTAQFESFIADMKSVIASVDGPTPVKGLVKLKQVVDRATTMIETVENA